MWRQDKGGQALCGAAHPAGDAGYPFPRRQATRTLDAGKSPVLGARALVPQRLAAKLDAQLQGMQASGLLPPGAQPRNALRPLEACPAELRKLHMGSTCHQQYQNRKRRLRCVACAA